MGAAIQRGHDAVYFEKDGKRSERHICRFSENLKIYDPHINFEEGDKVVRPLPNGTEATYTILHVDYHAPEITEPRAYYTFTLHKDSSKMSKPAGPTTTYNISGSTGIQIGNHNVQHLQAAMKEVLAAIDSAHATKEQKEEAKGLMGKFLEHPLVSATVGAGLPAALGLLT